ncbi:hypothetical protein D3C81_1954950 [compost metagenome]
MKEIIFGVGQHGIVIEWSASWLTWFFSLDSNGRCLTVDATFTDILSSLCAAIIVVESGQGTA